MGSIYSTETNDTSPVTGGRLPHEATDTPRQAVYSDNSAPQGNVVQGSSSSNRISPYDHSYDAAHPLLERADVAQALFDRRSRSQLPADVNTEKKDTKLVRNPVNLHKKSISIIRDETCYNLWHIEFLFDALVPATVAIHYCASEAYDARTQHLTFRSERTTTPEHVGTGMSQKFRTSSSNALNVLEHQLSNLQFKPAAVPQDNIFPIVIELRAQSPLTPSGPQGTNGGGGGTPVPSTTPSPSAAQHQYTYATLRAPPTVAAAGGANDSTKGWMVEVIGQKIQYGPHVYVMHEIYGIDAARDADGSGGGDIGERQECVICLSEERNTAVLPCRHMCLCSECAAIMRMASNQCPVCRSTATGLLQITVNHTQIE